MFFQIAPVTYMFDLLDLMIWFDLFRLRSPQLVEHSCSARMNWDLNKDIVIIIIIIIIMNILLDIIQARQQSEREYSRSALVSVFFYLDFELRTGLQPTLTLKERCWWYLLW